MSMSSDSEANQPAVDNAAAKAAEEAILKDVGKTAGPRARRWSVRPDASNAPLEGKMAAHNLGTSTSSIPEEDDGKILLAKDEQIFLIGGDNDEIENHALMQAIRKPPDEREEHDVKEMTDATRDVKFFKSMNDNKLHSELCRSMTFETVEKDTVIFEQGDEGTSFFILFTGAVKVLVNRGGLQGAEGYGSCVCVLEDGDSFGELALLGNGIRAATIMSAMPTQLLRVEKVAYDLCLHRLHEAELKEKTHFLKRIFLFHEWTEEDLVKLAKVVTRKKYAKNTCILTQGMRSNSSSKQSKHSKHSSTATPLIPSSLLLHTQAPIPTTCTSCWRVNAVYSSVWTYHRHYTPSS